MSARPIPEKFLVAFSFAGEQRDLVRSIAEAVEKTLGWGTVFFDEWFEYYIAGADADLKHQKIYGKGCALAVVCVSERYGDKPWTQAEHEAIRARQMQARASKDERVKAGILPIRVGDGDVDGILFNTIASDIRERSVSDSAVLIVERLGFVIPELTTVRDSPASPRPGRGTPLRAAHLHYLCDRSKQEGALTELFSKVTRDSLRRPVLFIVHGGYNEAHTAFIERMYGRSLPARLRDLGLPGDIQDARPSGKLTAADPAGLAAEVRQQIAVALGIAARCGSDGELLAALGSMRVPAVAPVFNISSNEAFAGDQCYVQMLIDYWSGFPDLPPTLAVIGIISINYVEPKPVGWFAKIFASKKPDARQRLRELILTLDNTAHFAGGARVIHKVLPELTPVSAEDVDRWFQAPLVAGHVRQTLLVGAIRRDIFDNQSELPMEQVIDKLTKYN